MLTVATDDADTLADFNNCPSVVAVRYGFRDVGTVIANPVGTLSLLPATVCVPDTFTLPLATSMALLEDPTGAGTPVTVAPCVTAAGTAALAIGAAPSTPSSFDPPLMAPVHLLFDLVAVSQGSTVASETLGSGNAAVANQSFTLQKSPLTYLASGAGWCSTLQVFVDQVRWSEVPSLYNQPSGAQVYVIQRNPDLSATVRFGDGVNGARLTTGNGNVVATYRYGSGAASPPAGRLTTIVGRQANLAAIHNPVAVSGGADPQSPADVKTNAPASVFSFGRAVSAVDYEVIASQAAGVSRVKAYWTFDAGTQRTLVKIYVNDDAGGVATASQALAGADDPNRPVSVTAAQAIDVRVACTLLVAANRVVNDVVAAATAAFCDPDSGPFSPAQMGIGQWLYRSHIEAALSVPGVVAVHQLTVTWTAAARRRCSWPSSAGSTRLPTPARAGSSSSSPPISRSRGCRAVADVVDGYAEYYAQRLWALLPAVYRTDDTDVYGASGPLEELLNRIGEQVAVVRRSIDRLWADQSIETCDDWVIPYIGDLLGTSLVNGLDAPGQRLDVAKTIHYRRRKGTLAVLEELARDVTGWDAHVVEGFRRLARTRHGLDPMVGPGAFPGSDPVDVAQLLQHEGLTGPLTGTPAGGMADLRSVHGAALAGSPFDESFHTADLRAGQGAVGQFGIQKLLVFLWRLVSFPILGGSPVQVAGCPDLFAFDPTGREMQMFLPPAPDPDNFADTWTSAPEWQVPGPITMSLERAMASLPTSPPTAPYPFPPPNPSPPPPTLVPYGYAVQGADLATVSPETGIFAIQAPGAAAPITVDYQYGFSGTIGAGPYDRLLLGNPPQPVGTPASVSGGTGLDAALGAVAPAGAVTIADSLTYGQLADVGSTTAPITVVLVAAGPQVRPVLRPATGSPPSAGEAPWIFTGAGQAELTLDGLLVSGCDVVLRGSFDTVRFTACTMDPGTAAPSAPVSPPASSPLGTAVDGRRLGPTTVWIEADPAAPAGTTGAIRQLLVDHCIMGPIRTRLGGVVETVEVSDSIVQGIPITIGPEYTAADVYDPALLAAGLLSHNRLSVALCGALPAAAQEALHAYTSPGAVPQAVVDGLNALVMGPGLHDPGRFATAALSPGVLTLAGSLPPPPARPSEPQPEPAGRGLPRGPRRRRPGG